MVGLMARLLFVDARAARAAFVRTVAGVGVAGRLTVRSVPRDSRGDSLTANAHALGLDTIDSIDVAEVVFLGGELSDADRSRLVDVLVDPLLQEASWDDPSGTVIETALLPGVTDARAVAVERAAEILGIDLAGVASGMSYTITGSTDAAVLERLTSRLLTNPVIEQSSTGPLTPSFVDRTAAADDQVEIVTITSLNEDELAELNRERGMSLDPAELQVLAKHFADAGREPTDVELETIAQTWSEHCAHKTFRAHITTTRGDAIVPLLRQLRDATDAIGAPFLRSAFVGNAGIISFSPGTTLAVKAETHNHPSAVEPFGGSNTGVGGVIRDVMGAAHHPIAITDILCFGPTDLPAEQLPVGVLHPRLIEAGVIAGVADYGNKIGLPTIAGAVLYDPAYTANPLVYAGCIGIAADEAPLPGPQPGDLVVVLGGRTGRDGLRGATFSSATMDATTGDVAGASVQIGDPIVEKLLIDLLAEVHGLYSSITDCGAGGLSSAVGEMAEGVGADVDVALAPLKYPGLRPWEVWLSEAQERMVLAVPPANLDSLLERCRKWAVEATVLGTFTGDGQLRVRSGAATVALLDTAFLHDGRPARSMVAELPTPRRDVATPPSCVDHAGALLALLAHPNLRSREAVVRRYDHEILGATVVRPLVGTHADGHADGVVWARPTDVHGFAIGIGVNPWYGELDPERMAHAVVDEAIRNVVAVGADPDRVALLDNFSWGDPRRESTLGQLVAAVQGCCDASVAHGAPFVSGKDSLNNEYLGADGQRHAVPPTLVITALAHVPDAGVVVTPDLKRSGTALVLVGRTHCEFGGSHLLKVLGTDHLDVSVPGPDAEAPARYRRVHAALRAGKVLSCHDVSEGGVVTAVAEMAIAGRFGAHLLALPGPDPVSGLFSESIGRLIMEVDVDDLDWLRSVIIDDMAVIGSVTDDGALVLPDGVAVPLDQLVQAFTGHVR